jgi:hypothetical protein
MYHWGQAKDLGYVSFANAIKARDALIELAQRFPDQGIMLNNAGSNYFKEVHQGNIRNFGTTEYVEPAVNSHLKLLILCESYERNVADYDMLKPRPDLGEDGRTQLVIMDGWWEFFPKHDAHRSSLAETFKTTFFSVFRRC